ncbi:cell envelope integrity protein CreD [Altererythrobacter sp. ZODW24]|uniref:cell envelope integrity protein CreD n=1 Tax=Altererythrobacter sp. ZODW24 TaxID=2185142 RepID=UPI001F07D325|nr:cell envelope integrity protein CreD [Altererythrobacter sp. ZODW24]
MKLVFAILIAAALTIPLLIVYALVSDREGQSQVAQNAIVAGWGGPQTVSGPVIAIPYREEREQVTMVDGQSVTRTTTVRDELYLSPTSQSVNAKLEPDTKKKSIYETVIYTADMSGKAKFTLPEDFGQFGVERDQLILDEAELRFGISDPRGLQSAANVTVGGDAMTLLPGKGLAATNRSGFYGTLDWDGATPLDIVWSYDLQGSRSLGVVPRGGQTKITIASPWEHPNFGGSFLPPAPTIGADGFEAVYDVSNLALGQAMVMTNDLGAPMAVSGDMFMEEAMVDRGVAPGTSMVATVGLTDPVDLYSQIDRSVKYGFLFIGFTFLTYLMFDIVAGARVAAAEYLLTGTGLVLFFVMLLAFAEVIGFALAYLVASAAIIGLLTAYSAAVLGSWTRAKVIGGMLVGLYALLYVLLSLEAWSLMIGSLLLFFALAAVMYATRRIDWSGMGRSEEGETELA